jgi:hypothetical protein
MFSLTCTRCTVKPELQFIQTHFYSAVCGVFDPMCIHLSLLRDEFTPLLQEHNTEMNTASFGKMVPQPLTGGVTLRFLHDVLEKRFLSKPYLELFERGLLWVSTSLHSNPCEYFFCGCFKESVYGISCGILIQLELLRYFCSIIRKDFE